MLVLLAFLAILILAILILAILITALALGFVGKVILLCILDYKVLLQLSGHHF